MGCEEVQLSSDLIEKATKNPGNIMAQGIGVHSCDVTGILFIFSETCCLKNVEFKKGHHHVIERAIPILPAFPFPTVAFPVRDTTCKQDLVEQIVIPAPQRLNQEITNFIHFWGTE